MYVTVVPAYGRDYKSKAEALRDWNEGKDFMIASVGPDDGRYVSKVDAPPEWRINIRYCKLTKIVPVR